MATKQSTLQIKLIDDVSGPAGKVAKALKAAEAQVKALASSGVSNRLGQQLTRIGASAADIQKVGDAWKKYAADQKLAANASEWTKGQIAKVRMWENATIASVRNVIRAEQQLERQAARVAAARNKASGGHAGAGILGLAAAHHGKRAAASVLHAYREFDDLVRYQRAVLGVSAEAQKPLVDQAIHLGATTKFNDLQVLHAQLDLIQRGIKQDVVIPITEAAANFAMALGTDLPTAAKTLEGILFSTGKHMHDGPAAIAAANKAASFATKLAKIGGLDEEDVRQFFKYGGPSASVAGLSDETMGAVAAILRRSNIRGDEAGVAMRAFSSRLVSPTAKGMDALGTMGIDYNKFSKMPGGLSVENLETKFKRDFGKSLTAAQRSRLGKILENEEVVSDRGEFVAQVTEVLSGSFQKNKKGKLAAKDAAALAKKIGDFHRLSIESIDTEGLLRAIIEKSPTLSQVNAIFGDRQGGRFAILAKAGLEMFNDYVQKLKEAGDNFHVEIAKERMAGFAGAADRAAGAMMNFVTAIGRANDSLLVSGANKISTVLNALTELPEPIQRVGSQMAGLAAIMAGAKGFEALTGGFGLKGSAVALDGAAANLSAAAAKLGGASGVPGAPSSPSAPGGGAQIPGPFGFFGSLLVGKELMDYAFKNVLPKPTLPKGYDPEKEQSKWWFERAKELYERSKTPVQEDYTFGSQGTFKKDPSALMPQTGFFPYPSSPAGKEAEKNAGAAGKRTGEAFTRNLEVELQRALGIATGIAGQINGALSFSATPSIKPKVVTPERIPGKQSSLDGVSRGLGQRIDTALEGNFVDNEYA
ncbi:MAG TPA: phage tail tape measure protein [Xanthobacteraceae bacterium]|nr:phage tail tape measure protein [Xanthobacteraceae bacterium]